MPAGKDEDYLGLLHLLKASSKKTVTEICHVAVTNLCDTSKTSLAEHVQTVLDLNDSDAKKLAQDLKTLLRHAVYHGIKDGDSVKKMLPSNFHPNLRDLLTKIIVDNSSKWKSTVLTNQVSMPRLLKLDWQVKNSESTNRQPTCLLQLKTAEEKSIDVEMSKASLDTMLDSLSKIQEQISSVSQ